MFSKSIVVLSSLFIFQCSAHAVITQVTGANAINGQGFGVDATTPRDGSRRNPFEQDTSIIKDKDIEKGKAGVCGRTLQSGALDIGDEMAKSLAAGVPTAASVGTVTMVLHQVNQDGAGPFSCEVDAAGTGDNFVDMDVTTDVPGKDLPVIGSRSNAKATDFPLVATLPAGTVCTGGSDKSTCLVRCKNTARAGNFGGCFAIKTADAGAAGTAVVAVGGGKAAVAKVNQAAAANVNGAAAGAVDDVAADDGADGVDDGADEE